MSRAHYKPVIEYCGGTEIGGSFVTGSLLQPQSLAAFSTPAMGCKLFILGEDGNPLVSKIYGTVLILKYFRVSRIELKLAHVVSFFFFSLSSFQPPDAEGVGELALSPHVFGASSSLLNGNHYNVYFKGMPTFQGQVNPTLATF